MPLTVRRSLAAGALAVSVALPAHAADGPRVVASIKPVHSLVAGVMESVGTPHLFVGGGDSPHTYAMRPSDAEALAAADAVFWIGPEFEGFLVRPIGNLAGEVRSVALVDAPGLVLHDYEGGHEHGHLHDEDHATHAGHSHDHVHDAHAQAEESHGEHGHAHDHEHGHAYSHGHEDHHADGHGRVHAGTDGHIWLDPANARAMVAAIAATLSEIDPDNASVYAANAGRLKERLSALEAEAAARLEPHRAVPFFTFHESFRYFAERFGLDFRGAITLSPERQPGAQRLTGIRAEIGESARACVFAEPQFPPSLVEVVVEGTGAGTGVVDPLGAEIAEGPELYFELIAFNVDTFERCFADS